MLVTVAGLSINAASAAASHEVYYNQEIVVRHSGMCLNVAHASPYNGAQVVQATCSGWSNERWTMRHIDTDWWTGEKFYRLVANHTGKCLEVANGSKAHATPVVQWSCGSGWHQQWKRIDLGNGYNFLIARHSDMCLNVAHASMSHAAPVVQAWCSNGENEQWVLNSR